jgi:aspartate carbamoyltransferase catalytic subunit
MQLERQGNFFVPTLDDYTRRFCVTEKLLKHVAPHAVVLHPGPMNRGVEIASDVADGPRSLIGSQVNMGVAVRMAVLFKVGRGQLHE